MSLTIRVEDVDGRVIPNAARFASYIGAVTQINGSLIEEVQVSGSVRGPEFTSVDGKILTLGAKHLPDLLAAKPKDIAAWSGAALHGFAHSRYSPRMSEPLREQLTNSRLRPTWNMMEDARIERLLLRDFPGWQPHLMGAVRYILLRTTATEPLDMASVYPLLVGRTYLPVELRNEAHAAFAEQNSLFVADAVRDIMWQYMALVDPGSEDCDEAVRLVKKMRSLIGNFGSDCGSANVADEQPREWSDPGTPEDDDDDDDFDPDDDGNQMVTDDEGEGDGEEGGDELNDEAEGDGQDASDADEGDADGDGADADDGDAGDSDDGADGDADGDADDADADGDDAGDGDDADADADADDGGEWDDESDDDAEFDDAGDGSSGEGGMPIDTSRLDDWLDAIGSSLADDERLADIAEAVMSGPMPLIELPKYRCESRPVPPQAAIAESEIARELRLLMDGARPGMRRRVDRGRFNVARVVREGGSTRVDEMFDKHDPGALRSTGCAVSLLADMSGSMGSAIVPGLTGQRIDGVMRSLWCIERAVDSVRGSFKALLFGSQCYEIEPSRRDGVWFPMGFGGGTRPLAAISSGTAWLTNQKEPNRLMIIVTDGAWDHHEACVNSIGSTLSSGISVAVFGIGIEMPDLLRRFADVNVSLHTITSTDDLAPAVGSMLVNRVRSAVAR